MSLMNNDDIEPISFMLMKSVFDYKLVSPYQKMMFFDLKGSTEGRRTISPKDAEKLKDLRVIDKALTKDVLKDNDLADSFYSLYLKDTNALAQQLDFDSQFLCKNNFLDYSLLLFVIFDYGEDGEGFDPSQDQQNLPPPNGMNSFSEEGIDSSGIPYKKFIYFGIIDYITTFNMKKQIEVKFKSVMEDNPSAVRPENYARRFKESMHRVIGHGKVRK